MQMPASFKTLAEANEAFDAEQAAKLSAQGQAQKNFADFQGAVAEKDSAITSLDTALLKLATAITERDGFKADNAKLTGERDALTEKVTNFDATLAEEANKRMQAALALHGQLPVNLDSPKDAPGAKAKADFSHLTGLEKAIAAHKAELSQSTK